MKCTTNHKLTFKTWCKLVTIDQGVTKTSVLENNWISSIEFYIYIYIYIYINYIIHYKIKGHNHQVPKTVRVPRNKTNPKKINLKFTKMQVTTINTECTDS